MCLGDRAGEMLCTETIDISDTEDGKNGVAALFVVSASTVMQNETSTVLDGDQCAWKSDMSVPVPLLTDVVRDFTHNTSLPHHCSVQ